MNRSYLEQYSKLIQSAIGCGKTTRMIKQLKEGDIVIVARMTHKDYISSEIKSVHGEEFHNTISLWTVREFHDKCKKSLYDDKLRYKLNIDHEVYEEFVRNWRNIDERRI